MPAVVRAVVSRAMVRPFVLAMAALALVMVEGETEVCAINGIQVIVHEGHGSARIGMRCGRLDHEERVSFRDRMPRHSTQTALVTRRAGWPVAVEEDPRKAASPRGGQPAHPIHLWWMGGYDTAG